MSDASPAALVSTALVAKKSKIMKSKGEKKPKAAAPVHPVYSAMIKAAIKDLKDRKGTSKQAISKFIMQKYKLGDNEKQINARIRAALKKGVLAGTLTQPTGTGAAGRFRLADKAEDSAKPKVVKKAVAAKPKSPKKVAAKPKKAAAQKPKKAKTPKKPKSPKKAAVKPKTAKSPKKPAAKKAVKPKTPKKPAAKKATPKA